MFYQTHLPPHLRAWKDEIEGWAKGYGLDFYETIFEVIDADDLNEIAAYGGFPTRYPHWSFGMAYEELRRSYEYGLSKIYEMVINNDPCYAYLMRCNHVVDQKLVMAHVYGHCLAPETEVVTAEGNKRIDSVRVGEEVLTHTGAFRRVKVVAKRWFEGDIHHLRVGGCPFGVRITGEHPVATAGRDGLRWTPAKNLRGGYHVGLPIPQAVTAGSERPGLWFTRGEEDHCHRHAHAMTWQILSPPKVSPYKGLVYNFSVEEDESYTLAAGFAVHNCDFFKNNLYFGHTSRKMMDEIANHGTRIRNYVERYGEETVEAFVDQCMSLDDLIDIHSVAIRRRADAHTAAMAAPADDEAGPAANRFRAKGYMDEYINPPAALLAEEEALRKKQPAPLSFPSSPEKDVLLFLIEHAPLTNWQRDVLSIIRDEAYYFTPQGQTKVANEGWACVLSSSLVVTDAGVVRAGDLASRRLAVSVHDGDTRQKVCDWAEFPDRETVFVRTRRGVEIEGTLTHRVWLKGREWKPLGDLSPGDRLHLARGTDLWATAHVAIDWTPTVRLTLAEVAARAGVSMTTVIRHRAGTAKGIDGLAALVEQYEDEALTMRPTHSHRNPVTIPEVINDGFGSFMGYMTGDGHISDIKRTMGLTTGDESQADDFIRLAEALFGVTCRKRWDTSKWRITFSSRIVRDLLVHLGMKTGVAARIKDVPDCILRSPKPVVAAFLRALYDCDGYAGPAGVILSTSSTEMSQQVQLLLLNFGVLSSRKRGKDECWQVRTLGRSVQIFGEQIGFGLTRKQERLEKYCSSKKWFKREDPSDEVVHIERRRADVFDFTVAETHRYVAQGLVNHNSYWHSTIMTKHALQPSELIDYADHHSGTMAMSGGRLNPYKLGIELLRDIEERWDMGRFGPEYDDCDDFEEKMRWNKPTGLGRAKIFEVRKIHNDITFIDTFLTPEFCRKHKLFSFGYNDSMEQYAIESRAFPEIKKRLLFSLTNFGKPWIYVVNGNHRNRGELLLRHEFAGIELKLPETRDTLRNIQKIWKRPVFIETKIDNKNVLLGFDGQDHTQTPFGEDENAKRPPAKPAKQP